jgi:signal transduction histidine kinase/ActR/RegA family two-component response regulator/PAS domain-containing protein
MAEAFVRGIAGLLVAAAVLWLGEYLVGLTLLPGIAGLGAMVAVSLLPLAAALVLVSRDDPQARQIGKVLGAVVAFAGTLTIIERAFVGGTRSGTLWSALELALLGGGAATIDLRSWPERRLSDFFALGALFVVFEITLQVLYAASGSVGPRPPMELTGICLFGLTAVALLCVRPDSGPLALLTREAPGSALVRQLLPLAVAGPALAGLLAVIGLRDGWMDSTGAISLLVTLAALALLGVLWIGSTRLRNAEGALNVTEEMHGRLLQETTVRSAAERARAHYLQLLGDLEAVVWEAELESGQLKLSSPGSRGLLGDSPQGWRADGDFWTKIVHPRDRERAAVELLAAADEGRDCEFEFRAVRADGAVRWLHARLYADDAEGGGRWNRGVMIDVTERKEIERRLDAQNEVARVLGESQSLQGALPRLLGGLGAKLDWDLGAAWTLDRELGVLRAVEVWQAAPDVGITFAAATRGRTFSRGEELPGRVWGSGAIAWIDDVAKDGSFARAGEAEGNGLRGAVGFPIRVRDEFLGMIELWCRDVRPPDEALGKLLTSIGNQIGQFIDRRRSDDRHREKSSALETVNRLSPTFSGMLDVDRLIQELTDAATKLADAQLGTFFFHGREGEGYRSYTSNAASRDGLGLGAARPTRFPIRLFSSDGALRIDDVRATGGPAGLEGQFSGTAVASYLAVPVVSRGGRILGGIALSHSEPGVFTKREERIVSGIAAHAAVALENAELYEAERRAREAAEAASRAKDEFLAMLGHELRNPIGAIRNSVEALEMSQARSGDGAGAMLCSIIARQTDTLAQLVDDLLDVTRLISGKVRLRTRVVDLRELVGQTLESLRAAGRASRHFVHFEGEPVFVDGDPVRLEQIVTNLVENAIKYTAEGGEIEIAVHRAGEDAQLRVRDNGQGIEPDLLPRIFDLFVQGKQSLDRPRGGLGIGLTLVRRLSEMHGGSVEAESAGVGRGSEFRVRIPAKPTNEAAVTEALPEAARVIPRRVLIAEDHSDSRESLRLLLEASGHRVTVARNGDEAVDLALADPPEIALIDIGLPGLDGYDVAREIRAADSTDAVFLVALTGYGQPLDRRRALESGFNEHLVKPLNREKLLRLMASLEAPTQAGAE